MSKKRLIVRFAIALFRATDDMALAPVKRLYDSSHLAVILAGRGKPHHQAKFPLEGKSVTLRVIPFVIRSEKGQVIETGRLVTTLLAPPKYHSQDLIALYVEQWEEETGFEEIKAHLMTGRRTASGARSRNS